MLKCGIFAPPSVQGSAVYAELADCVGIAQIAVETFAGVPAHMARCLDDEAELSIVAMNLFAPGNLR